MEKDNLIVVGEYILNTRTRVIYKKNKEKVLLSNTLFLLLKCFINNTDSLVTKPMIMEYVWKEKVVGEANINQNIKKLRDVLDDSATMPQYIETIKGEGYRLIADVKNYQEATKDTLLKLLFSARIYLPTFIVLIGIVYYFFQHESEQILYSKLHPLSNIKGHIIQASLSPDKQHLLFVHQSKLEGFRNIYIKPIDRELYIPIDTTEGNKLFPRISPDQSKLIYFKKHHKNCGLFIRKINFNSLSVGTESIIMPCKNTNYRIAPEWINDNEIFLSIYRGNSMPSEIYHYDLASRNLELISKPQSRGFGDYELKYSPENKMLAYVRDISWTSSEIWTYNLLTKVHKKINSTPILLGSIGWSNDWIYFRSKSKQISRIKKDGSAKEVVSNLLSPIIELFIINENKIGVIAGDPFSQDISSYDINAKTNTIVISSNHRDFSASPGRKFTAFLSNRSGETQIWIKNISGDQKQITNYKESHTIRSLATSTESNLIMFIKSGYINIINKDGELIFDSSNYSKNKISSPVFDLKNNRIIYTIHKVDGSYIEYRNLDALNSSTTLFRGEQAVPCTNESCLYYLKINDSNLYKYYPKTNTSSPVFTLENNKKFTSIKILDKENIIYTKGLEANYTLYMLNLSTGTNSMLLKLRSRIFSLDREKKLIYTNTSSLGNTDIMYVTH